MSWMRGLLSRQDGIALPVAISVMLILTLLGAAVATGAVSVRHSSADDEDSKRALAAAEAGLQVASYRLSSQEPATPPTARSSWRLVSTRCRAAPTASANGNNVDFNEDKGAAENLEIHVHGTLNEAANPGFVASPRATRPEPRPSRPRGRTGARK